jgi:hypothetical protein
VKRTRDDTADPLDLHPGERVEQHLSGWWCMIWILDFFTDFCVGGRYTTTGGFFKKLLSLDGAWEIHTYGVITVPLSLSLSQWIWFLAGLQSPRPYIDFAQK